MKFEERLIAARKAKGLSQEALAERLGVSRQAVSKWETGECKPDTDKLMLLCEQLEVGMEYLCFGRQAEPHGKARRRGTVWTAVIAAVCLAVGAVIGYMAAPRTQPECGQEPLSVTVEEVICSPNGGGVSIRVLPQTVPTGATMQLLVEDGFGTDTVDATFDGHYFTVSLQEGIRPMLPYRITAVFCRGEQRLQLPLLLLTQDADGACRYTELWKE